MFTRRNETALTAAEIGHRRRRQPAAISETDLTVPRLFADVGAERVKQENDLSSLRDPGDPLRRIFAQQRTSDDLKKKKQSRGLPPPRRPVDANRTPNVSDGRLSSKI